MNSDWYGNLIYIYCDMVKFRVVYIWLLLTFILVSGIYIYYQYFYDPSDRVCKNWVCIDVRLATTPQQHAMWLMDVKYMPRNEWMLFIFEDMAVYSFWMKNTLISLDMIWIDDNYRIVYIKHDARPCGLTDCDSINPNIKAKYVLEVNSWISQELWFKQWDVLQFKLKKL